jgi:hypothetical protein
MNKDEFIAHLVPIAVRARYERLEVTAVEVQTRRNTNFRLAWTYPHSVAAVTRLFLYSPLIPPLDTPSNTMYTLKERHSLSKSILRR